MKAKGVSSVQKRNRLFLLAVVLMCVLLPSASLAAQLLERAVLNQWCLDVINAPKDLGTGEHPVRVAVIDSGFRATTQFVVSADIAPGHNYVFKNAVTTDLIGHGTQTTGIIVGGYHDNDEIVGLGSQATIVPLVWVTKYPSGVWANGGIEALSTAIRDAIDIFDCKIINISSGIISDDVELREAVAYAEEMGAIVISAVGNSNAFAPDLVFYPAAYETVVGVGSVNADSLVSQFSQRTSSVMVTAPGERVPWGGNSPRGGYATISGTSYSAAYVSAFATLLLSKYPEMTPADFRQLLQDSSRDLGEPGYDTAYGYGVIDVSLALELSSPVPILP